ncbi:MAG TPA: isoprenylcysteine carboxylmethyltransferase family protein [Deltaproteobacteria bacterium]|jgi:protein-S-isoprenylcysteine O-methyltransferase Ste14|nr:isoprenylcysteine carboxylmethyltransferase family protein [Deltaproteobacteria bacterium]MDI9541803.1 isoprenylcysteine carboxylmethyltransferase family protein [Pseudomonadota bacterium]NLW66480.1 isoprenylcysteine carboxylmethyltransferase family protein [Bacteriovoracaceae bacterium]HOD72176.1 isoprenylcysteine carboxylmethyltransferase family protein [Deltaproteobacteria bacterium]HQM21125.1 isoprenylcysteine carboxylmethyltransferase family protein [Deltaproteobacteria bacterium]
MGEPRKIWYRLRGALIVPFYLFVLFYSRGEFTNPMISHPIGAILFGAGLALRIWAQMHLHYRLKTHKILTLTGPYRYVRNPIYIGNTLILVGITVLEGLLWFVPIMLLACAFTYHMTVLYEEGHLTRKYGQGYVDFLNRVPRWLPRRSPVKTVPAARTGPYFWQSMAAELHILLLLIPLILL